MVLDTLRQTAGGRCRAATCCSCFQQCQLCGHPPPPQRPHWKGLARVLPLQSLVDIVWSLGLAVLPTESTRSPGGTSSSLSTSADLGWGSAGRGSCV